VLLTLASVFCDWKNVLRTDHVGNLWSWLRRGVLNARRTRLVEWRFRRFLVVVVSIVVPLVSIAGGKSGEPRIDAAKAVCDHVRAISKSVPRTGFTNTH
jgi:hypothetical protein